jgi:hypothetical protein
MSVRAWLPRLLLIVAILGLVARPFASAVYGPAMAAASMAEMPEGMPCCPDDQPQTPDCQKACLLMAACAAKCFSAVPIFPSLAFNLRPDGAFPPGRDLIAGSMAEEPPARPPRT